MREIKFRAWDNEKREFLSDDYGPISVGDSKVVTGGDWQGVYYTDEYTIEQYTGINDKNGKEIYEGDIIQENLSFDNEAVDGIFKYKVYWNENELCWSLKHIGNESIHDDLWECSSSVEVIGNIHENPELLEGEKDD